MQNLHTYFRSADMQFVNMSVTSQQQSAVFELSTGLGNKNWTDLDVVLFCNLENTQPEHDDSLTNDIFFCFRGKL